MKTQFPETILDAIASPIFVLDLEGRVLFWNRAIEALTGISAEEIMGHIFANRLIFPENMLEWELEFQRIVDGRPPVRARCRWKLGRDRSMELTCSISLLHDAECVVSTIIESPELPEFLTEAAEERRDISRFLHDTISQDLVALSFTIGKLQSDARSLLDRCCRDIRVISYILAPPSPGDGGLHEAVEWYTGYLEEAGIQAIVEFAPGADESLSPEATTLFLTAVQDWTARAIRKCFTTPLYIGVHRDDSGVVLELRSAVDRRMADGWTTLRARVGALGGSFEVTAGPAEVIARLSLPTLGPE